MAIEPTIQPANYGPLGMASALRVSVPEHEFPQPTVDEILLPTADQVLISANPHSGSRPGAELVTPLADLLRSRGYGVAVHHDLDVVAAVAREMHEAGRLRALVAAGGDGTVAELVNRTPTGLPIAVFPLGTANLLAGYLGMERNIQSFADVLQAGRLVRLDAGVANGRIFLLIVGCGFDAEVVRRLHEARRGHISYWTYIKPILGTIRSYAYPALRVYCDPPPAGIADGQAFECRWLFVSNIPRYALDLRFSPAGRADDGLLDVCAFHQGSFWTGLRYLAFVIFGWHGRLTDCTITTARRIRVESAEPSWCQLDGDPGFPLPLDIEILPKRLTLVGRPSE